MISEPIFFLIAFGTISGTSLPKIGNPCTPPPSAQNAAIDPSPRGGLRLIICSAWIFKRKQTGSCATPVRSWGVLEYLLSHSKPLQPKINPFFPFLLPNLRGFCVIQSQFFKKITLKVDFTVKMASI